MTTYENELWEGKLPRGWQRRIKGHIEDQGLYPNGGTRVWKSSTYYSWFNMLQRCYTNSHPFNPKYYSDVRVYSRWVEGDGIQCGFLCFLEDMGERPEGMTLDRIDPTGHYTPDNCRWADTKTQASNKRKRLTPEKQLEMYGLLSKIFLRNYQIRY